MIYPPEYDQTFGDERICACRHPYYRHFDTYAGMSPVGCKYCDCVLFHTKKEDQHEKEEVMTGTELFNALRKLTPADRERTVEIRVQSPFQSAEGLLHTVSVGFSDRMVIILTANEKE